MFTQREREIQMIRSRILAHRGLWFSAESQNSEEAIKLALAEGFGVETDLRDFCSQIVVSHDIPNEKAISFSRLIEIAASKKTTAPLALNIKADGLIPILQEQTQHLAEFEHFYFDMSIPQTVMYLKNNLPVAIRLSEFEEPQQFVDNNSQKSRIWLDSFKSEWWTTNLEIFEEHKETSIYIVSPELHGRNPKRAWGTFANLVEQNYDVYMCTDHPLELSEILE